MRELCFHPPDFNRCRSGSIRHFRGRGDSIRECMATVVKLDLDKGVKTITQNADREGEGYNAGETVKELLEI